MRSICGALRARFGDDLLPLPLSRYCIATVCSLSFWTSSHCSFFVDEKFLGLMSFVATQQATEIPSIANIIVPDQPRHDDPSNLSQLSEGRQVDQVQLSRDAYYLCSFCIAACSSGITTSHERLLLFQIWAERYAFLILFTGRMAELNSSTQP